MWSSHDSVWNYEYNKDTKTGVGNPSCQEPWEKNYELEVGKEMGDTNNLTEFKQSYYFHNYNKMEFENEKYYDMIFARIGGDMSAARYWLANRYVCLFDDYCEFGLHCLLTDDTGKYVRGLVAYQSNDDSFVGYGALRPIVSINLETSGYKLIKNTDLESNAEYQLVKNNS